MKETSEGPDRLLNVKSTAERLSVHPNTVRRWQESGFLQAVIFPSGVRRFRQIDVEELRTHMFGQETTLDFDNPDHIEKYRAVLLGDITVEEAGPIFGRMGSTLTVNIDENTFDILSSRNS